MDEQNIEHEINLADFTTSEIQNLNTECYRVYGVGFADYARVANRLLKQHGGSVALSSIKNYFWNFAVVELVALNQMNVHLSNHGGNLDVRYEPTIKGLKTIQEAYAYKVFPHELFAQWGVIDLLIMCRNLRFLRD